MGNIFSNQDHIEGAVMTTNSTQMIGQNRREHTQKGKSDKSNWSLYNCNSGKIS